MKALRVRFAILVGGKGSTSGNDLRGPKQVALQAHQRPHRHRRQGLGDRGLAGAGLTVQEKRALQLPRQEDGGGQRAFVHGVEMRCALHVAHCRQSLVQIAQACAARPWQRRRATWPTLARPASSIAQLPGSGTTATVSRNSLAL